MEKCENKTENSSREEIPEENPRNMAQESVNSKRKDGKVYDDIYSDCSSVAEDTYSEVSSIYSDPKSKKSKGEMRIYTSLKAVVKNTVKKTKEKDNERKSCDKISVHDQNHLVPNFRDLFLDPISLNFSQLRYQLKWFACLWIAS